MKTLKQKIEIMQACEDGKTIQFCDRSSPFGLKWVNAPINPVFNWGEADYKIRSEPEIIYMNIYENRSDNFGNAFSTSEEASRAITEDYIRTAKFIEVLE